jgi:peptide/nickel transport system permease protein
MSRTPWRTSALQCGRAPPALPVARNVPYRVRYVLTPRLRVVFLHVLPNCLSPLVVKASMDMGTAILTAASLGFIGLGAQPPHPEWGAMISHGRNYLPTWWWYSAFPGLAIYLTVLGFNLLGDGLRDLLDPKSRG